MQTTTSFNLLSALTQIQFYNSPCQSVRPSSVSQSGRPLSVSPAVNICLQHISSETTGYWQTAMKLQGKLPWVTLYKQTRGRE